MHDWKHLTGKLRQIYNTEFDLIQVWEDGELIDGYLERKRCECCGAELVGRSTELTDRSTTE